MERSADGAVRAPSKENIQSRCDAWFVVMVTSPCASRLLRQRAAFREPPCCNGCRGRDGRGYGMWGPRPWPITVQGSVATMRTLDGVVANNVAPCSHWLQDARRPSSAAFLGWYKKIEIDLRRGAERLEGAKALHCRGIDWDCRHGFAGGGEVAVTNFWCGRFRIIAAVIGRDAAAGGVFGGCLLLHGERKCQAETGRRDKQKKHNQDCGNCSMGEGSCFHCSCRRCVDA